MKITQIEKLKQLVSRTDMTGNQKVEWLTNFIDEHVTEQLRLNDVVGRSEQLICDTCKSGLIDYPEINRRTCRCGGLGYNVTD